LAPTTHQPVSGKMNTSGSSALDKELFESYGSLMNSAYPHFLKRLGLDRVAVKAEQATITDSAGKVYIDCVGGYGLFNLGHNHPKIIKALKDQLNERQLFTKPFITELPVRLAEHLSQISPDDLTCSFVCNSGSEAIDNAIKLVRLHKAKGEIITATNSFHGYTFGALSASGIPSFKKFFEPLVPGMVHVPFGDIGALEDSISSNTAAILLEPIQHEAGVSLPPENYLPEVRRICDQRGIIFILDEIKTGFGKTGYLFACEHFKVVPDILVIGKSLGGGLIPIGALITKKELWKKFGLNFAMSASSFAGNILASRAALATIQILQEETILDDCKRKGHIFLKTLQSYRERYPKLLKASNGLGLLIGVETVKPQAAIALVKDMIGQSVLTASAFGNPAVLMIEPPLVISLEQTQAVLTAFEKACERLNQLE